MKYLLDTCTFIWLVTDPTRLSPAALQITQDPNNEFWFSIVSSWEIALRTSMGKFVFQQPPEVVIPDQRKLLGINLLVLREDAVFHLPKMTAIHKDPFDRMLICQAIIDDLTILTPDPLIQQYSVKTAW
jgi:PIN domain nuclease of toxin-antitoxin system